MRRLNLKKLCWVKGKSGDCAAGAGSGVSCVVAVVPS